MSVHPRPFLTAGLACKLCSGHRYHLRECINSKKGKAEDSQHQVGGFIGHSFDALDRLPPTLRHGRREKAFIGEKRLQNVIVLWQILS